MMVSTQRPLGSGFGHRSTAEEVLAGIDLHGTCALVTGGHSGLGLETTRALTHAGAQVIVATRDLGAATKAIGGMDKVDAIHLDLANLSSVAATVRGILSSGRKLNLLVANAGIMACPESRVGRGWEAQFATNHLGHFALTLGLLPVMAAASRVVVVSSLGHHAAPMQWGDLQFTNGYDKWRAYGQSKTANALFAVHLDHLVADRGIRAFSLHPGKIFTPLQRYLERADMIAQGWIDRDGKPADPEFKTIAQGAATQVWAATSRALDGYGGVYCEDCDIARTATPADDCGVCDYAIDPAEAERLWHLSLDFVGLSQI
jgi:NAD(P)-dependent dehydrogenase (short-subunit alcohol dehydrogenase family)